MKKVLFIFLLILFIPVINAENILDYELDWETKPIDAELAYNHIYKDGYIFEDYGFYDEFFLSYYSNKGELIKRITIKNDLVSNISIDDYIYVYIQRLNEEENNIKLIIRAYNDKLELVKEIETITITSNSTLKIPTTHDRIKNIRSYHEGNGMKFGVIKDGNFYTTALKAGAILNKDEPNTDVLEYRKYTKDLSSYTVINSDEFEQLTDYLNNQIIYNEDIAEKLNFPNNEYLEAFTIKGNDIATYSWTYDQNKNQTFLKLFRDNKQVWSNTIEGSYPYEIKFIDKYLMTFNKADKEYKMSFNIYDIETGETKHTHIENKAIFELMDTKKGFIYNESECSNHLPRFVSNTPNNKISPILLARSDCFTVRKAFSIYKQVNTKITSGKGKITVEPKQAPDDEVTFTVTPDEGYTLGEVKVTDTNGNVIVFKNNKFTMPSADVTIEAVFLPIKNPATKDIAILTIAILGITAGAVILLNYKKVKENS